MTNLTKLKGGLAEDAQIVGNDPQNPIIKLRVVTSESWRDNSTGEQKQSSIGHNVSVFGWRAKQLASNIQLLKTGTLVNLVGRLNYSKSRTSNQWFTQVEVLNSPEHDFDVLVRFNSKQTSDHDLNNQSQLHNGQRNNHYHGSAPQMHQSSHMAQSNGYENTF